jgi:tetratricopeptide (TPR) repeat protein
MQPQNPVLVTALSILSLTCASCAAPPGGASGTAPRETTEHSDDGDVIGAVRFETSCAPEVQTAFDRAVATLHSFEFGEARDLFEAIASEDPDCGMAAWGVAMTHYHPLWAPPTRQELSLGAAAVARARSYDSTERERLYIEAIGALFDGADDAPHSERAVRYEEGMARVYEHSSDDTEAEIFYALAILSNADPTDKTYAVQQRTGAMLEPLFVEMPDHPGLAHYIIHSYDYPDLADRAVHAADRYLEIAPSMPHALHMSGHIYTQLGMWDASIGANIRSAASAVERAEMFGLGEATQGELHALDYLVYAHLQRGEDTAAEAIVDHVNTMQELNLDNGVIVFNAGAVPVRYAVERHDWEAAAELSTLSQVEAFGGNDQSINAVALRYWARVIGGARSGRLEQAQRDLVELERVATQLASEARVWGRNTAEVFRLQATAWLALANGEPDRAVQLMQSAVELEEQTDKSSISPGRVLPAHEQLGDVLAALDRPQEALAAYEESMTRAPRRFNTYVGAARAAMAAGETDVAHDYYQKLLELAADASTRAELAEARDATM